MDLMPKGDYNMRVNLTGGHRAPFPPFLPLHVFDDTEFDVRNPKEWLELGVVNGEQHPVPGKALLQTEEKDSGEQYAWKDVGALDYDQENQLFLVQVVGTGCLQHNVVPEGVAAENGIVNGEVDDDKAKMKQPKVDANQHWVPRMQLLFAAEDPVTFAERVAKAYVLRRETEALLRYNLYIDCMPMEGVVKLDPRSLERMITWAKGMRNLRNDKR